MGFELSEGNNIAKPTISNTHGWSTGCDDTTGWTESETGLDCALSVINGGKFELEGTCDSAAGELATYTKDITNISTNIYPNYMMRWKTSHSSNALRAVVEFDFTSGSQFVYLGFNTGWTVSTGTLTADKTLDKVILYADDDPNTVDSGTYQVYYDFLFIYADTFTFPYVSEKVDVKLKNRYVDIAIPGRVTDVTQYLGAESAIIEIVGDMEQGSWGTPKGEKFLNIIHNASTEPFQWLTCDDPLLNLRVTLRDFNPYHSGGVNGKPNYRLLFKEYRESKANDETPTERLGLDL